MQVGTLIRTKRNRATSRINLPMGYGIVTRDFDGGLSKIVYVHWFDENRTRPVNAIYLEVICK